MLPELRDESVNQNTIDKALEVRAVFLETITGFFAVPHFPVLTQAERDKVTDKVLNLLQHETRPRYWHTLSSQLTPNVKDGVVMLTPTVLIWAGRKKPKSFNNKSPQQKIGHAKNGRVIKDAKGL